MSRTYNTRHESRRKSAHRGPKNRPDEDAPRARLKSRKQVRTNERVALRKEYR